jgi:hypothetical protein
MNPLGVIGVMNGVNPKPVRRLKCSLPGADVAAGTGIGSNDLTYPLFAGAYSGKLMITSETNRKGRAT